MIRCFLSACAISVAAAVVHGQAAVIPQSPYIAGRSYFGRAMYIEYVAGNLPLVFSVPHGGTLKPGEISDRTAARCGAKGFATLHDRNTLPLAREIRTAFAARFGGRVPHLIINRLSRVKLDPNRTQRAGACGDVEAEIAWTEYHRLIELASRDAILGWGGGWYTDLHGHSHPIQRIELGYGIHAEALRHSNATLDSSRAFEDLVAFRTFSRHSPSALLRGPSSLGSLLAEEGYPAVPSASDPAPSSKDLYASDGPSVSTHGCRTAGTVCGVQMEVNLTPRSGTTSLKAFAAGLVRAYARFLPQVGIDLTADRRGS